MNRSVPNAVGVFRWILFGVFAVRSVLAADFAWQGTASALWNETDENWSGAGTVWTNGAANSAVFGDSSAKTVTAGAVTLNNLTFTADGYTVGGGPLLMYGGPIVGANLTATLTAGITNVGVWGLYQGGTIVLNPGAGVSNMFYALKASTGAVIHVVGGTNLITQAGSSAESGPAFWVNGGTLVVGGGLLKTTAGPHARVSDYGTLWVTNGVCDLSSNDELLNAFNSPGTTTVGGTGELEVKVLRIVKNNQGADLSVVNINTGGTLRIAFFRYETDSANRKGTINFNGGKIVAKQPTDLFLGGIDPNWTNIIANVLAGGAIIDSNGYNISIRLKLTGSTDDGGLTKMNNGTLSLYGTNSYTGATVLKGGTLNISADHNLGAVPPSSLTNVWFLANTTLQSGESHTLAANRTLWITNAVTATFDSQSYTQTVFGTILCAETNATFVKSGSGMVVLDPGAAAVNSFGTLHTTAGTLVIASGTTLVTRANSAQNAPGLRISGGTLLVAGGLLKTTESKYVNVDGGHLLVTNGVADTTSCDEILNGIGSVYGFTTVSGSGVLIANSVRVSQNVGNMSNMVVSVNTGGVLRLKRFYIDFTKNQKGMVSLNGGTVEARVNAADFLGTTATLVGNDNDKWLTNILVSVREGGAVFDTAGCTISIKQPLYTGATPDGGLVKRGAGTLTLLNTNTYNGVTIAEGGTLVFGRDNLLPAANGAMAGAGAVLDVNGKTQVLAVLGGGGTVTNLSALTVTDMIAPGDAGASGTLTLAGLPASMAGCVLSVSVSTNSACDCLHVQGDLDLTALSLSVENMAQLAKSEKYTVASCTGTLTGPFSSVGALPARWTVKYDTTRKTASLVYDFGSLILLR